MGVVALPLRLLPLLPNLPLPFLPLPLPVLALLSAPPALPTRDCWTPMVALTPMRSLPPPPPPPPQEEHESALDVVPMSRASSVPSVVRRKELKLKLLLPPLPLPVFPLPFPRPSPSATRVDVRRVAETLA